MSYRPPKSDILRQYERRRKKPLLGRILRERNIYLRTESGVRYISIKPWMQVSALAVMTAFMFWTAYATVNTLFKDRLLAIKERRIAAEQALRAQQLAAERTAREKERSALKQTIRSLDARLMADQEAWLERVEALRRDYVRLLEHQRIIDDYLKQNGLAKDAKGKAAPSRAEKGNLAPRGALEAPAGEEDFRKAFARPFRSAAEAEHVLDLLRGLAHEARRGQLALLEDAQKRAQQRLARAKGVYRRLSLIPERIIARAPAAQEAAGGPFIPLQARAGEEDLAAAMNRIAETLEKTRKLTAHIWRLPVAMPMRHYKRISSRFGYRSDPFRHRLALHAGVDFKAPYGAPIYATAPGTVTRAGWTGSYGRLVEIRHDNGVVTRYAHQSRVLVRVGQRVKAGQIIGRLGNTGRSTGPHLHYETRLHGRPVNPARFWKARNDIRKIEADE